MFYTYGVVPILDSFKNAGSKSMAVNGSVTPVVFSYSPSATHVHAITELTVVLKDEGTTALTNFGALAALTNGIKIEVVQNSNSSTIATIKDNADLASRFTFSQFGNGAVLSILGISTAQGFGNSTNVFIGSLQFPEPIVLDATFSDMVKITVQDNLSAVDVLQMGFHAVVLA